eukprot:Skav212258  [mRNA]  locus=scaffold3281:152022:155965:+ [translate_table: standard]
MLGLNVDHRYMAGSTSTIGCARSQAPSAVVGTWQPRNSAMPGQPGEGHPVLHGSRPALSVMTVEPQKAEGRLWILWAAFAKALLLRWRWAEQQPDRAEISGIEFYESHDDIENARVIFSKVARQATGQKKAAALKEDKATAVTAAVGCDLP